MLQLGDFYHEKLTKESFDQLVEDCKAGKITLHDK
jgi:NADH-quinone oxidoreductase subunit E